MTDRTAPADHPIHPLIAARWSPRAFDETRAISAEQLATLLEAARWAASCFNEQPWMFVTARRHDEPEDFARLLSLLSENNQSWAWRCGALVIGLARQTFAANGNANAMAGYDLGQAVAQLALQAVAMGLITHQMRGFDIARARSELRVPAGVEPMVAIAIGHLGDVSVLNETYAAREVAPRVRKPQSEFVVRGRF
ncbi:MAG: nitroreductase family protein [Rhodovarius sp.]|nr:nitroreductase family protein [Rhodovarius sp.]MCX7933558.1 nitroreductase family protein [Rhodovarius sp.]MDW8313707.1 nitroreductase family protein [Rhodovarius sp.]